MEQLAEKFDTNVPHYILYQVANPGQSKNCYDGKVIADFDPDDFKEYVEDHLNGQDQVLKDKYGLLPHIFPYRMNIIEELNKGSECNDNEHFNKHENWRASLYDIWEDVKTYSSV